MEKDLIIKAMECCNTNSEIDCRDCPYRNKEIDLYDGCVNTLVKDALALIKQLTEENERLKGTITQLGKNNDEIARVYPLAIKEAKADTARTIQNKLRGVAFVDATFMGKPNVVTMDDVDRIISDILEGNGD